MAVFVVDKHPPSLIPCTEKRIHFEYAMREYVLEECIRVLGYFTIPTAGYYYLNNLSNPSTQQTEERRFLLALKGQVSALSIG